jgi:putative ABC transport system ATP-binding protein
MIELQQITKAFNRDRENEFWALKGVDLKIKAHEILVLRGPSGSGKTTLLSIIGCLSRPTSGRVRLHDKDISGFTERFLTDIRRKTFGFVFQQFNLIRGVSVLENTMIPAYPLGLRYSVLRTRALQLLELMQLSPHVKSPVEWLSGGEVQRVAIARALINDPEVVIADEPTANLDTRLSREFLGIVETLRERGKTVLLSSHDPLICDSQIVDKIVDLRDGKPIQPS